jgi:hypothetical protein
VSSFYPIIRSGGLIVTIANLETPNFQVTHFIAFVLAQITIRDKKHRNMPFLQAVKINLHHWRHECQWLASITKTFREYLLYFLSLIFVKAIARNRPWKPIGM